MIFTLGKITAHWVAFRIVAGFGIILVFSTIGYALIKFSNAAAFTTRSEAESGAQTGNIGPGDSVGASQSQSVAFGLGNSSTGYQSFQRLFSANSPLNMPLPANLTVDPNSNTLVTANFTGSSAFLNSYSGAHTIYNSGPGDPVYNVKLTGNDGFAKTVTTTSGSAACNPLHIPNSATIAGDSDKWVIIVDSTKPGLVCEIWQTAKNGSNWSGIDGDVYDMLGSGVTPLAGYGTGSGLPASGLMIRASEVKAGVIPHPLVFPAYCNAPSKFVWPASKTDGICNAAHPLIEGMLFQLDPSFDCNTTNAGLERMVCVALQKYGAYDGDNSGSTQQVTTYTGFMMETDDPSDPAKSPPNRPGDYTRPGGLYCSLGSCGDFGKLSHIPLTRLRLLNPLQP